MTVNEITTNIAGLLEREDDFTFRRSLLKNINGWRSALIKQSVERTPADRKFFTQTAYVEMEMFREIEDIAVCAPRSKSKKPLPRMLRAGSVQYDFVGSIDGNVPFGIYTFGTEKYLRSRFTDGIPRYSEEDRHLIINNKFVKKVRIVGIPDDPEEWFMFTCSTGDCDFWNSEYPAPAEIEQRIIQSILTIDFRRPLPHENKEVEVNEIT